MQISLCPGKEASKAVAFSGMHYMSLGEGVGEQMSIPPSGCILPIKLASELDQYI